MSSEATPISSTRFAAALPELPLATLHAKRYEIQNSIAHLEISNGELQSYAHEGDTVCKEAIAENVEVIERMKQRVELLRAEVENRGFLWEQEAKVPNGAQEQDTNMNDGTNGQVDDASHGETHDTSPGQPQPQASITTSTRQGGSLNDEELARRLTQQMEEDEGIHL